MIDQAYDIPGFEIFLNCTEFLISMINEKILVLTGFGSSNGVQTPSNNNSRLWKPTSDNTSTITVSAISKAQHATHMLMLADNSNTNGRTMNCPCHSQHVTN
jgi:hypothetical protein